MCVYISSGFLIDNMLIGLCFLSHSDNLCLSIFAFTPLTLEVIIYIVGFMSTIFTTVFYLLPYSVNSFVFHSFSAFCLSRNIGV